MQNEDKPAMTGAAINPLSDEDIIEFAETVLADLDDGGAQDRQEAALVEDDDDIIDLTEVAEKPADHLDVLDLTEDIEPNPPAQEDGLDLDDIAEKAEDAHDAVDFELADGFEDLMIDDDAVTEVDDELSESAALHKEAADGQDFLVEPFDVADEIEDSDRSAADHGDPEAGFDLEPDAENARRGRAESPLAFETGQQADLPEFEDRGYAEAPAEADRITAAVEAQPLEEPSFERVTDGHQEKLALSEADRRILEEELGLAIAEAAPIDSAADLDTAAAVAVQPLDDSFGLSRFERAGSKASADAENPPHGDVWPSQAAEQTPPDLTEASGRGTPETFDFDFDETAVKDAAADTEDPMIQPADSEAVSTASLLADGAATGMAAADGPIPETLSGAQFETAVERAVTKIVGQKIETMLFDAIERAVTKEIERLKTLILGDLDHDR